MDVEEEEEEDRSQDQEAHFVRACNRNAHGQLKRAILRGNLQEKCRTPIPGTSFRARLRSRNAHGHLRRAILCKKSQEKCQTRMGTPQLNTGP